MAIEPLLQEESKMNQDEQGFCGKCGKLQTKKVFSGFNTRTGKKEFYYVCEDTSCSFGCSSNGGHVYGFFGSVCRRCGNVMYAGI